MITAYQVSDLFIMKNPSGSYSFVGNVPSCCFDTVPAKLSDVLGCRAFTDENGNLMTHRPKFPKTLDDALKLLDDHHIRDSYNVVIHD